MYKIKYTEKNNQKASEYETRSLLYLLSMRSDSDDISIFFIDSLNDITGTNDDLNKLWDAQAKGVESLYPTSIGESLITLFENYISDLNFIHSILILPKIKLGYLIDDDLKIYDFNNFRSDKKSYLITGLENEYKKREKLTVIPDPIIEQIKIFLDEVIFVVALQKDEYIKEIIHFANKGNYPDEFYNTIFNEIRDKQSALKNICIESIEFSELSELLKYNKHLKSSDIKIMVLNRFVGTDLFKHNYIPISYVQEIQGLDSEDLKDLLQENNSNLSRTFFNKNNKQNFWLLLENIITIINHDKGQNIRTVFSKINHSYISINDPLDENSLLFFIALIKDGLDDN